MSCCLYLPWMKQSSPLSVKDNTLPISTVQLQIGDKEEECCLICFEPCTPDIKYLGSICSCNSNVHEICLNRWRYTKRGTPDEVVCRLCERPLPPFNITEVNVLMCDIIMGTAVLNLGYEYFIESIKNIYCRFGIKQKKHVIHIICKVDNLGFKVYKGFHKYNKATKHKILYIRIVDINE